VLVNKLRESTGEPGPPRAFWKAGAKYPLGSFWGPLPLSKIPFWGPLKPAARDKLPPFPPPAALRKAYSVTVSMHTNPHRLFQSSVHSSPMDYFNLIKEATRLFLDPLMPPKLKYKHRLFHLCGVAAFWLHVNLLSCNFNFLTILSYLHIFIIILGLSMLI
jgi:hypothetical protein